MRPVLVGYSSGATFVYAALVQAPATTFRGAISLGFCPDLLLHKPMCKGSGLTWRILPKGKGYWFEPASTLEVPFIALQGTIDQICEADSTIAFMHQVKNGRVIVLPKVGHGYSVTRNWMPQFKEAYRGLLQAPLPDTTVKVAELPDLPLHVIPSSGPETSIMALHISGDGGWGVTDRGLSEALASHGIPVVGLNSIHYFWHARTPEQTAGDVTRVLRHYLDVWHKDRIILIGYSFGADVLPFVVNRLPDDLKRRVILVVYLGLSHEADFSFHVTSWLGASGKSALPVQPEVEKLRGMNMVCFYGSHDSSDLCKKLPPGLLKPIEMQGGHRVGGDFDGIAAEVLANLPPGEK